MDRTHDLRQQGYALIHTGFLLWNAQDLIETYSVNKRLEMPSLHYTHYYATDVPGDLYVLHNV